MTLGTGAPMRESRRHGIAGPLDKRGPPAAEPTAATALTVLWHARHDLPPHMFNVLAQIIRCGLTVTTGHDPDVCPARYPT